MEGWVYAPRLRDAFVSRGFLQQHFHSYRRFAPPYNEVYNKAPNDK